MNTLSKDTIAYNIGWDAAMYGLQYFADWPVELRVGWAAAKKSHPAPKKSDIFIRKWIQLRVGAYKRNKPFSESVTPNYLKMINMGFCPVLLEPFTYATGTGNDWSVDRIDNERGYDRQNLISMSTRANSAKDAFSYQEIEKLLSRKKCIPGLDYFTSAKLWAAISMFCRSQNDDINDANNYYVGTPIAPDAPLNWIMSLQVLISISIVSSKHGLFQTPMCNASKASGNFKLMNKMFKRLCKYQSAHISWPFLMFDVWSNKKNIQNYRSWLRGLRPIYHDELKEMAIKITKDVNSAQLKENLEKWAL